jgi:hypothetical protein
MRERWAERTNWESQELYLCIDRLENPHRVNIDKIWSGRVCGCFSSAT